MDEKERSWNLIGSQLHDKLQKDEVDQFMEWIKSKENKILFTECEKIYSAYPAIKILANMDQEKAWKRIENCINDLKS